jgi:hypothetical protein
MVRKNTPVMRPPQAIAADVPGVAQDPFHLAENLREVASVRTLQRVGIFLTPAFVLFCGCGGIDVTAPTTLSYTTAMAVYTKGVQITPDIPTSSGGTVTSYSVSPDLPAGLALSASTGIVSGTPTVVAAAANYTVTATNFGGNTTAVLNITVMVPQLIPNLNQQITPLAHYDSTFEPLVPGAAILPDYPDWQVGQAVTTVVSPDGLTLLILTSGYNRIFQPLGTKDNGYGVNHDDSAYDYPNSKEYVFIYDISQGTPVQKQVVAIPNS